MLLSVAKWLPFPGSDGGGGAGRIKESTRLRGSWVMGVGPPLSHPSLTLTHSVRAHLHQLVSFLNKPVLLTHRSLNSNNNCVVVLLPQREATCHLASPQRLLSPFPSRKQLPKVSGAHILLLLLRTPQGCPSQVRMGLKTCPFSKHIP